MDEIIILFWSLLFIISSIAFFVTAYHSYIHGSKISDIILKLVFAFIIYGMLTVVSGGFLFVIVFAGAHTEPPGNALNLQGFVIMFVVFALYLITGWLSCSFIKGDIIKFWKR